MNSEKEKQNNQTQPPKRRWDKLVFWVGGISATAWFLLRVIPKPSRASYPCMQAAAPVMSTFVIYLLTLFGTMTALRKARQHFRSARYSYAVLFFVLAIGSFFLFTSNNTERIYAQARNFIMLESNAPVGVGHGIFPGRVVWAFDPKVATWDGTNKYWWEDKSTSPKEVNRMFTEVLYSLTGQKNEAKAWDALFRNFNQMKNRGANGYRPNEKIAIKINQNNTTSHADTTGLNGSPQLVYSMLRSLVKEAGVSQKNITVFDASRFITDCIFNKCHKDFPEVVFVDNSGGDGRTKSTYVDNAIPYSIDNGKLATGLAKCAVEADYLINVALLKGHRGQGVTRDYAEALKWIRRSAEQGFAAGEFILGQMYGNGTGVQRDLREALFLKIQSFSFGNLDQLNTGELMVRLSSDTTVMQRLAQVATTKAI